MKLVRMLVLSCLKYNYLFRCQLVPGFKHIITDHLSHCHTDVTKRAASWLDAEPSVIRQSLSPSMLLSWSASWFGHRWHQLHGIHTATLLVGCTVIWHSVPLALNTLSVTSPSCRFHYAPVFMSLCRINHWDCWFAARSRQFLYEQTFDRSSEKGRVGRLSAPIWSSNAC